MYYLHRKKALERRLAWREAWVWASMAFAEAALAI
jgi:hypothetical protein